MSESVFIVYKINRATRDIYYPVVIIIYLNNNYLYAVIT